MSGPERPLSDAEVRQIGRIIEILNQSTFDRLELEFGDLKLTVGRGGGSTAPTAAPAQPHVAPSAPQASPQAPPAPAAPPQPAAADTVAVHAPMIGRFYSQPEPGAPPFVTIGQTIDADTTVGLIEVMKTFNAVRAGTAGVVTEICVADAALVEHGQPLVRLRPKAD